jgi:NitT/TauT family transport system ATP-binding protein
LTLEGVTKSYQGALVIKKASLSLMGGSILALSGPSGLGKSTLLEIMAGLVKPDSGSVKATGPAALMFQDDALVPWLSALGNLLYAAPASLSPEAAKEAALARLKDFDLPPEAYPGAMSGGMRRRLNLARVLMARRPLVLFDEPFAFLDQQWREAVASLVAGEAARGAAVALTDHGDLGPLEAAAGGMLKIVRLKAPPLDLTL